MCTFAKHDLTRDPPFSNLDLISCRNVLIYFDTVLQQRVMPVFHYALVRDGVLLLGKSESIGRAQNLFGPLDPKHHTYEKRPAPTQLPATLFNLPRGFRPATENAPSKEAPQRPLDAHDLEKEANEALARALAPTSILVDDRYDVLHFRGHAGAYLEHPAGRASFGLFQMLREGLNYELRKALEQAREARHPVSLSGVPMKMDGSRTAVDVTVTPFDSADGRIYFIISFSEPHEAPKKPGKPGGRPKAKTPELTEAELLHRELEASQEHLRTVVNERDTNTEELRAALEEVQSSNEELQSTNEELETAKEELQSINEELSTVNDELQARNRELSHSQDDLANLLQSAAIPMIMLDEDLRIRRFTPGTETVLNLLPSDIDRPIADIRPKVTVHDLEAFVQRAIELLIPQVREVKDEQGRWYSMRARPYRTAANRIEGAVLSFVDVDDLKRAMDLQLEAKELSDALNQVNTEIGSVRDLDKIMRRVMAVAAKVMRADSAVLLRRGRGGWDVTYASGLPKGLRGLHLSDDVIPHVLSVEGAGAPLVVEDAATDERVTKEFLEHFPMKSELVIPLFLRDRVVGTLLINHSDESRTFTRNEIDFAGKLAASVSLSLENARLFDAEHSLAESLRQRLAPPVPVLPGLDVAAASQMAAEIKGSAATSTRSGRRATSGSRSSWATSPAKGLPLPASPRSFVIQRAPSPTSTPHRGSYSTPSTRSCACTHPSRGDRRLSS